MPDELPKGWVKTTLGELSVPSRVRALGREEPELPYVGLEHVEAQTMKLLGHGEGRGLTSSSVRFNKGDVIYGKMRPYLNKVWLAEFDGLCSAEFLVFPNTEGLNNQFLAYRLNSQDFVNFANQRVSGERPRVDFDKLARFPVLLPPTREQERIVAKLDALLSRVGAGEAAARLALDRLKRYRAAVLQAAAIGELTSDWRKTHPAEETGTQFLKRLLGERRARWEDAELKRLHAAGKSPRDDKWQKRYPEPVPSSASDRREAPGNWSWASVEQLNPGDRFCAYGVLQPGPHVPRGVLLARVGDINEGRISTDRMRRIAPRIAARYERTKLQGGEVLITLVGAIGRTAVVPGFLAGANTARAVGVIPLTPSVNAEWVELWFRSPDTLNEMIGKAHEVARKTLNLEDVRSAAVPLPPLEEQVKIVSEVQHRLNAADRLTLTLNRQLERARGTRQSLLREVFAGKLVAQDPKDESASVLLGRIRAAREAQAKKPKAKRMQRPKFKPVETLEQLEELVSRIGKGATPERILLAAGLGDDVEKFFDLLRAGREKGSLLVPIGKGTSIKKVQHAN